MDYDKAEKQHPQSPDNRSVATVALMQTDQIFEVSKYSWQDGSKKVTLYFDPAYGGGTGECEERLLDDTLTAEFTPVSFEINYTSVRANNTSIKVKRQFRVPLLYGDIKPNKCTYEIKRNKKDKSRKLIVVKLTKAAKVAWQDLEGKEDRNAAHDDYSDGDESDNNGQYRNEEGADYANNYANAEDDNNNNNWDNGNNNNRSTYNNYMTTDNNNDNNNNNGMNNNGSNYNGMNNNNNNGGSRYRMNNNGSNYRMNNQNNWSTANDSTNDDDDQPRTRRQSMLEVQDFDM